LKTLAERRARAAGEVMRLREIAGKTTLAEVDAQLRRLESRSLVVVRSVGAD
jgi:hypothetical protein